MQHSFKCDCCGKGVRISYTDIHRIPKTIICPNCKEYAKVPPIEGAQSRNQASHSLEGTIITDLIGPGFATDRNEPAWLIVHDENTRQQTFTLRPGPNLVGRLDLKPSNELNVGIETNDRYMSRNHFRVQVDFDSLDRPKFILQDLGSTNGTFLNGNKDRRVCEDYVPILSDGDTIQAGRTKIVFRLNKGRAINQVKEEVGSTDFSKTIIN